MPGTDLDENISTSSSIKTANSYIFDHESFRLCTDEASH